MEIWKDIGGYEGFYQISSKGRVKALERVVLNKNGKPQRYPEKMLNPEVFDRKSSKYCRVALCKNHKVKRFLVHRLVASAFIPNPLNKEFVNHIDNNGENNSLDNLEWCTHSENMIHAQKQGRLFKTQSKAGKIAGIKALAKKEAEIEKLVGSSINAWTILSGKLSRKGAKLYVHCKCICGTERLVESTRLKRGEAVGCSGKCSSEYKI